MRIVVAVETWGAAHTGSTGAAWSLAHGLSARGHRVEVVAARCLADGRPSVHVRTLPAQWPEPSAQRLAADRLEHATRAVPPVQHDILAHLGARTDPAAVDVRGVDLLVAVGLRSPHVRGLAERARGRTATVLQLQARDLPVAALPVVRLALRGHRQVTGSDRIAASLAGPGRYPEVVPPLVEPPPPPWPDLGILTDPDAGPIVVVDTGSAGGPGARPAVAARRAGRIVRRVTAGELATGRVDELLAGAAAVVVSGADDAGDVPGLALRYGRPLVVDAGSPGADEVRASGAGWVVGGPQSMRSAVAAALGRGGSAKAEAGVTFATTERSWDRWAAVYERVVDGPLLRAGEPEPAAGRR